MRWFICFVLIGCRSEVKAVLEPAGESTNLDADGDGFLLEEDCDDSNPQINPDAVEICDSLDNNCDGFIDEDVLTTYYRDSDGDGFGNAAEITGACESPEGYVSSSSDCNDNEPNAYPGAAEVCDGIDNNCNAEVDEGIGEVYYSDMDKDGYGDADTQVLSCSPDDDLSSVSGDCDDSNNLIYPGASEYCDGLDNDCNGLIDDSSETYPFYVDADADGYGDTNTAIEACTVPPGYVVLGGDCDDSDSATHPGATETCDNIDNNCSGEIDDNADDALQWFLDYDADGYGASTISTESCDQPAGYVDNTDDCDDLNPNVYPSAVEVCDEVDNDCNGWVDSDDPNISGETIWYLDVDEDGYGSDTYSTMACDQPTGFADNMNDCDDDDPVSTNLSNDADCDGILTALDCDDSDASSNAVVDDADCDGIEAAVDCDDNVSGSVLNGISEICASSSCKTILDDGYSTGDGAYWIDPDGNGALEAFCDMTTDGGGWTLIMKMQAGVINHYQTSTQNVSELTTVQDTNFAKMSDDQINGIQAEEFWTICGGSESILQRDLGVDWYSNHGVAYTCSYSRGFFSATKADHSDSWNSPMSYSGACGGGQYNGGWVALTGIHTYDPYHTGCYNPYNANTSSVSNTYDASMPGGVICTGWDCSGFLLVR